VSERLALCIEVPLCVYRPDDLQLVVGVVLVTSVCSRFGNRPPEAFVSSTPLTRRYQRLARTFRPFGVIHALWYDTIESRIERELTYLPHDRIKICSDSIVSGALPSSRVSVMEGGGVGSAVQPSSRTAASTLPSRFKYL
jgi:hypothetical protein